MAPKIDRRQLRTKQLLRNAMLELIEENGVQGLTVTDIANRADVNRGTFYLHYQDAPDMLQKVQDEVFASVLKAMREIDVVEMMRFSERGEPYPKIIALLEEFSREAYFFRLMIGPHGNSSYIVKFRRVMQEHIAARLAQRQPSDDNMLVPRDYLITFIASANMGIISYWIESGMQQTPREIAVIIMKLVQHGSLAATGLRNRQVTGENQA